MIREAKKILITGGTGFIGKYLCDRLLKDGYNLYILTRNKKLKRTENLQKKLFINNFSEIQNIDIDIVINLSGETISQRWTKDAKSRIYNSRIAATRDLVNFMGKKKTKPTLFLSASAVGYYGVHDNQIFTEENDPEILHSEFARYV
jgi:NAD dependent epimerase/dehydratase family enzyme